MTIYNNQAGLQASELDLSEQQVNVCFLLLGLNLLLNAHLGKSLALCFIINKASDLPKLLIIQYS